MVSRWGALYNVAKILDNRYSGTVFVRMGTPGHMFNQHYLAPLFPRPSRPSSSALANIDGVITNGTDQRFNVFLDKIVEVDEKLALAKEDVAMKKMGLMRGKSASSFFEFGNGEILPADAIVNGDLSGDHKGDPSIQFLQGTVAVGAEDAKKKTVRQLSRLWQYEGGQSPAR